jgi:hypothetical protein
MDPMDIFETLEFNQDWVELGIITPEKLKRLEAEWAKGEDTNTEHYRWRAFLDFMESKGVLDENTAKALYNLGANDPDWAMGGSIMAEILRRKDCPNDLLERAAKSDRKFLRKIAKERIEAQVEG